MDVSERDSDAFLYKHAKDLVKDLDHGIATQLRKPDGRGGSQVRPWVRLGDVMKQTCAVLDLFQELPQLLDPHLPKWIPFLAETYLDYLQTRHRHKRVRNRSGLLAPLDFVICKILYSFCKVRGEKVIVRFLNVETKYLELLLTSVEDAEQQHEQQEQASPNAPGDPFWSWEQRYIALLWLSHLMLAPFDLSTISSADLEESVVSRIPGFEWPADVPGLTMRVIPLAVKYIARAGKERDAAKALLVRMAMRRDMQELGILKSLVHWALESLRPKGDQGRAFASPYLYLGVLSFLAGLLRSASETSDLDAYLSPIFDAVLAISQGDNEVSKTIMSLALARKMMLKVLRSLTVSILRRPQDPKGTEVTESAIGYLLDSLSDNDTPVRLSASKALSIITLKLDPEMASQVVDAVLEALNRNLLWTTRLMGNKGAVPVRDVSAVNPLEWHGLMLTLSHLLYRRSPPAAQLSDIFRALLVGLSFEQRGVSGASLGSNVRDAACFGIWALARRYTTQELLAIPTRSVYATAAKSSSSSSSSQPDAPATSVLQILATELVMAASLDSEGNIRRGASAALQELIGRHPDTVEHGIGVVQVVDYHAVARRSRAMLEVATGATTLSPQYGEAVVDGILSWRGIGDLDTSSRRVAGAAFGILTAQLAGMAAGGDASSRFEASIDQVMYRLEDLQKRQVEERHGLLICFAALVDKLSEHAPPPPQALVQKILGCVTKILEDCEHNEYRRPELIAEAASRLVVSALPLILGTSEKGSEMLSPDRRHSYTEIASISTRDETPTSAQAQDLITKLRDVMPKWLSRNETETVEAASTAGLMLLVLSAAEQREAILAGWAGTVATKTSGPGSCPVEGYFHALALAQPLAESQQGRDTRKRGSNRDNGDNDDDGAEPDLVCRAFLQRWDADKDIETRVALLQSLVRGRMLRDRPRVFLDLLEEGLNNYTTTARGDEGSLVRVQALRAVQVLWADLAREPTWAAMSVRKLLFSVLRLSAEKLDRVRREAKEVVALLLTDSQTFRACAYTSKAYFLQLLNLASAPLRKHALELARAPDRTPWMAALLAGLVSSADTGNEDLVMDSRAALCEFCSGGAADGGADAAAAADTAANANANADALCAALVHNLRAWAGEDRVVVPTLEVVGFLLSVGLFARSVRWRGVCLEAQRAGYKSGNVRKVLACVKVYGGMAAAAAAVQEQEQEQEQDKREGGKGTTGMGQGEGEGEAADDGGVQEGGAEARRRLGALMRHPWPKVRSAVVDELWGLGIAGPGVEGELLLGVDWAKTPQAGIKTLVQDLGLV
ncbi:Tubulin-specific chaperone D [Escovopsis weberi]|uniref:Tubulin-specific chaperone D n=1 Tax=Escovopsis weberi TaxID=150374 RepID=A0A0M8MWQ0_ESCWE|nr:Tubulin-specific chaperone D [Escovopsis weberi]